MECMLKGMMNKETRQQRGDTTEGDDSTWDSRARTNHHLNHTLSLDFLACRDLSWPVHGRQNGGAICHTHISLLGERVPLNSFSRRWAFSFAQLTRNPPLYSPPQKIHSTSPVTANVYGNHASIATGTMHIMHALHAHTHMHMYMQTHMFVCTQLEWLYK